MINNIDVTGVILLGGQSKRMGKDKKYLLYQNKTFVEIAIELLDKINCKEIILSGKSTSEMISKVNYSNCKIHYIVDIANYGPLGGILQVISKNTFSNWLLFIPVDMPLLSKEVLALLTHNLKYTKYDFEAAYFKGYVFPFLIKSSHKVYSIIKNQLESKDFSIKSLLNTLCALKLDVDKSIQERLVNVNTPHEYMLL